MSLVEHPRNTFALDTLFARSPRGSRTLAWCSALALMGHVVTGFALSKKPATVVEAPRAIEFEMAPLPAPEPDNAPPPPAPAEEEEAKAPAKAAAAPRPSLAKAAPPAAAKAGALLTAKEDAPQAAKDEPVEFVSDATGKEFGSGVVARGGTANVGVAGAVANGVIGGQGKSDSSGVVARGGGDAITPASNLSRVARLEEADACRGFFPRDADVDFGLVSLVLVVRAGGEVTTVSVANETPKGQGFGKAARSCLLSKRFSPALDREGRAVTSSTVVKLRFVR
jgi:protein TonB